MSPMVTTRRTLSASLWLAEGRDLFQERMKARPKSGRPPGWKEGLPASMDKPRSKSAAAQFHRYSKSTNYNPWTDLRMSAFKSPGLNDMAGMPSELPSKAQVGKTQRYNCQRGLYDEDPLPTAVEENIFCLEPCLEPDHWRLVRLLPDRTDIQLLTFGGWALYSGGGTVVVEPNDGVVISATIWIRQPSGNLSALSLRDLIKRPGVQFKLLGSLQHACPPRDGVELSFHSSLHLPLKETLYPTTDFPPDQHLHRTDPYFPKIDPSLSRPGFSPLPKDPYFYAADSHPKRALFAEHFHKSSSLFKARLLEKAMGLNDSSSSLDNSACLRLDVSGKIGPCRHHRFHEGAALTTDQHLHRLDPYFPQVNPALARADMRPDQKDPYLKRVARPPMRSLFATNFMSQDKIDEKNRQQVQQLPGRLSLTSPSQKPTLQPLLLSKAVFHPRYNIGTSRTPGNNDLLTIKLDSNKQQKQEQQEVQRQLTSPLEQHDIRHHQHQHQEQLQKQAQNDQNVKDEGEKRVDSLISDFEVSYDCGMLRRPPGDVTADEYIQRADLYFPELDPALCRADLIPHPPDPYLRRADPNPKRAMFATCFEQAVEQQKQVNFFYSSNWSELSTSTERQTGRRDPGKPRQEIVKQMAFKKFEVDYTVERCADWAEGLQNTTLEEDGDLLEGSHLQTTADYLFEEKDNTSNIILNDVEVDTKKTESSLCDGVNQKSQHDIDNP